MHGEYPITKIIGQLERDNLLPAILFRTSRRQCDVDVDRVLERRSIQLSVDRQKSIEEAVHKVIDFYKMDHEVIYDHPHYAALVQTGVGAHHAGQLLLWRLLLEELMTRSVMRMMVATGTVAAGVDFPARTVVVTAHSKRGSEGFNVLTSSEFQQMSGRAGRRGKDAVGICLIAPSQFSDARVIHEVALRPPEPLRSSYFASPSTVLNLLKFRDVGELRFAVSRSLAAFLDRKHAAGMRETAQQAQASAEKDSSLSPEAKRKAEKRYRRRIRDAEALESKQENLLEDSLQALEKLEFIAEGKLTPKGLWAAELCTSLVLELAQAINQGIFDESGVEELAALVASIAGDPHRAYINIRRNPIEKARFREMQRIIEEVRAVYKVPGRIEIEVQPDAAVTVITWMEAQTWSEFSGLLRLAGVAEGDAARIVSQTADHLNQISRLTESHPVLAATADEARHLILRPPLLETLARTDVDTISVDGVDSDSFDSQSVDSHSEIAIEK